MANSIIETIKNLEEQEEALSKELEALRTTINVLRQRLPLQSTQASESQPPVNSEKSKGVDGYDVNFTLKNKILFFLKQKNRFLHTRELAQLISENGGVEGVTDESSLVAKISPALSRLKRENVNKIVNYQEGNSLRNTFWGSQKWLDDEGKIKEGHEFDRTLLWEGEQGGTIEL